MLINRIKKSDTHELEEVASEIRERILDVVSTKGGHLSSSLGAVDLIVSMHKVFDVNKDVFMFDVSHQAYAHKLITDRWDKFDGLRQFEGISGFTKPHESPYDYFVAGHSSTSLSVAMGAAKAIALKGETESRIPVVLIGDGSMTAGMVFEAMNEIGEYKHPMIIIINDNEMSIGDAIGSLSRYLSKLLAGKFYQGLKQKTEKMLQHMPKSFTYLAKRFDESLHLITPGLLFEELGLDYIGPIDGHNIADVVDTLEQARGMNKPVVIHAQTVKGKGYKVAEGRYEKWHGVSPFDPETGEALNKSSALGVPNPTAIFTQTLLELAEIDKTIVGATAAMPGGTGIGKLIEKFPDRFWDVAIAEQHAVTSMAALAKEGFKPFCTIYSTFLQRGYDQVIHDVAISKLPVIFAIDRAGIVGEDGETHQGLFDISFLRVIPNMVLFAPRDNDSLKEAIKFSTTLNVPCAFRFPRGNFIEHKNFKTEPFQLAKAELLIEEKSDILLIGYGNGVARAAATAELLAERGIKVSLLDLRFVKPLDRKLLLEMTKAYQQWFVFSDSVKQGGVASALMEFLANEKVIDISIRAFEFEDVFLPYGNTKEIEKHIGLLPDQLADAIESEMN
jgi:1-deoxy-D-xylulose-5-phosphate synthase